MYEKNPQSANEDQPEISPVELELSDGEVVYREIFRSLLESEEENNSGVPTVNIIGTEQQKPDESIETKERQLSKQEKLLFSMLEPTPENITKDEYAFSVSGSKSGVFTINGFEIGGKRFPYKAGCLADIHTENLRMRLRDTGSLEGMAISLDVGTDTICDYMRSALVREVKKKDASNRSAIARDARTKKEELIRDNQKTKIEFLLERNQDLLDVAGLNKEDFKNKGLVEIRQKLKELNREYVTGYFLLKNKPLLEVIGADKIPDLDKRECIDAKWIVEHYYKATEANYYIEANSKALRTLGVKVDELQNGEKIFTGLATAKRSNDAAYARKNEEAEDAKNKMSDKKKVRDSIEGALDANLEDCFEKIEPQLSEETRKMLELELAQMKAKLIELEKTQATLKEEIENAETPDIAKKKKRAKAEVDLKVSSNKARTKRLIKRYIKKEFDSRYEKLFKEKTKDLPPQFIKQDSKGIRFTMEPGTSDVYRPIPSDNIHMDEIKALDIAIDGLPKEIPRSDDEMDDEIRLRFLDIKKRIAKVIVPKEAGPVDEIFFFSTGFVIRKKDGSYAQHAGSPLDERIMAVFSNDQQRSRWRSYWNEVKQNDQKAVISFLEKNIKSKMESVEDYDDVALKELMTIYQLNGPQIIDKKTGAIMDSSITSKEIETLKFVLPKLGPFIEGFDNSDTAKEITLKSTRLNMMDYLSGKRFLAESLLCTSDRKIKIRVFQKLIDNSEPEKNDKIMARLTTAVAAALFERLDEEQHDRFSAIVGNRADVSVSDFYKVYQTRIPDDKVRRRVAERTFFLKAFNAYINGIANGETTKFFESIKRISKIA